MSQVLNKSVNGQPISLGASQTPLHETREGTVARVVLVVSNVESTAKIISISIDGSSTMDLNLDPWSIVEIPEILVQDGSSISASAPAVDQILVVGRVDLTG